MSVTIMQGNLEKQASKSFLGIAPWRSRWIVLTNDDLAYYGSNKAGEPRKGGVAVADIRSVDANAKKRPWGFSVVDYTGTAVMELGATSKEERDVWISAISTAAAPAQAPEAAMSVPASPPMSPADKGQETLFGKKVTKEDFELVGVIGQGSFAKVLQVKAKVPPNDTYAMKVLKKKTVVDRGQMEHTMAERAVLEKFKAHPFIVNLHYAFQTKDKLYFVLDFCPGGELFFHLKQDGCFSPTRTMHYVAEISSALDYMHSMGIIYRDLKPENLLIDEQGFMKLADFGLCKRTVTADGETKAKTFCGTPEYIAPEILLGQEKKAYGKEVDWWALGTLLYEMLSGLPPFYDKKVNVMYRKILNDPLRPHRKVSAEAFALVQKFLNRKPAERLGSGPDDFEAIKAEPFFAPIDWARLNRREYKPEFVPHAAKDYVDPTFSAIPIGSDAAPSTLAQTLDGTKFKGFTFAGASAME
jgi:serine/threonine protein kinase